MNKNGWTVVVNNSTNINKTNNHLSPQLTEHDDKTKTYPDWNPGHDLGRSYKCCEVKPTTLIIWRVYDTEYSVCSTSGFPCFMLVFNRFLIIIWLFCCICVVGSHSDISNKYLFDTRCHLNIHVFNSAMNSTISYC